MDIQVVVQKSDVLLGIKNLDEMIGRSDLLEVNKAMVPWKAKGIDYSKILYRPRMPETVRTHQVVAQDHGIDKILQGNIEEITSTLTGMA